MEVLKCEECKKARFRKIDSRKFVFCTLGRFKANKCISNNYDKFEKGTVKIFYEHN